MSSNEPPWWIDVQAELHGVLSSFGNKVQDKLIDLQLHPIKYLRRKNPFLYRIRGCDTPERLAEEVVNALMSSSEETMFGTVLEQIVISVARAARGGRKSIAQAIDLEWDETEPYPVRVLVQIKSGPNWGNAEQRRRMEDSFKRAKQAFRADNPIGHVICVEGCCYGKNQDKDLGSHRKIVGMRFWQLVSQWDECSTAIMDLLEEFATNGLAQLKPSTIDTLVRYLEDNDYVVKGRIDWRALHTTLAG